MWFKAKNIYFLTIDQKKKKNEIDPVHLAHLSSEEGGGNTKSLILAAAWAGAAFTNSCPNQSVRSVEKDIGVSLHLITVFKGPFQMTREPQNQ